MSLNFDPNSNPSLVRTFHAMKKLKKCVNFILTVPVFLHPTVLQKGQTIVNFRVSNNYLYFLQFGLVGTFSESNDVQYVFFGAIFDRKRMLSTIN
jgi:hypothetical protein